MPECPNCETETENFDGRLSDQYSGPTKVYPCPQPSCPVIHFKAAPKVVG